MKKMNLTLLLLLFAVISFAQNVPPYVPTNGLVGWWPFNGNANDESGNGNNGTVNGATLTTDRFGQVGNAYSFDGISNDISVQHNSSLNILPVSISVWFKTSISQPNKMLVNKYACQSQNGYSFRLNSNKPSAFYFSNSSGTSNYLSLDPISTNFSSLNDNSWHNGTIIIEPDSVKLYIDGILLNSDTVNGVLSVTSTIENLRFGSYPQNICFGPQNFFYDGQIDDIGIWNRALTQQEITDLYNANICYQLVTVTDTLLINTGSITGFNPLSYENTIKIWPNPSNSQITIDAGDLNVMNGYSIRIVNALGQQMFQTALTQQQYVVNLSGWTGPGLYYVNIINPQGVTIDTKKIVIQ